MSDEEKKVDDKVEGKEDTTKSKETKEETKGSGKTFSQEELSAIMSRTRDEGKTALLKKFGYESEDELNSAVSTFKAMIDATKSPEDKVKDTTAEASAKVAEAVLRAELAEAKVEALSLGAKPENVDDIIVLARAKKTSEGDWKTAVSEVKTKYAVLFGEDSSDDEGAEEKEKSKAKDTGGDMTKSTKKKKAEEKENYGAKLAGQAKPKASDKHKGYFE